MLKILKKEKEKYIYDSVQELILEVLRDKFVRYRKTGTPTKRGRPKKTNDLDFLKRKKIFSKEGVAIDI
jgi:hypothetical protein